MKMEYGKRSFSAKGRTGSFSTIEQGTRSAEYPIKQDTQSLIFIIALRYNIPL